MGIPLTDTLTRQNDADFAIADGSDIGGGGCVVADLSARDNLPSAVLKVGMICFVQDTGGGPTSGVRFELKSLGPPVWAVLSSGGGGGLPPFTVDGAALFQSGTGSGAFAIFRKITQADIQANFAASLFGAGSFASTKEVGDTIINPSFTASYVSGPATSATIDDGSGPIALTSPFTAFAYSGGHAKTYTVGAIGTHIVWTLAAATASSSSNATATCTALGRIYFGLANAGTYNSAVANALAGSVLSNSFARTYDIGVGDGVAKATLVIPEADGTPTVFISGGFAVPFAKVASNIMVTNGFGATVACGFYQSVAVIGNGIDLNNLVVS